MEWIHLNVKSGFSFFHSSLKIEDIVHYAKKNQLSAIALTDQSNMFGTMEFYRLCRRENIQPILGMEIQVESEDNRSFPLILLAKSNQGYQTLTKMTAKIGSKTEDKNFAKQMLAEYSRDLIAILPSERSGFSLKTEEQKNEFVNEFKQIYPDFYLGIEWLEDVTPLTIYQNLKDVACCLLNEVRYEKKEDAVVVDVLACIKDTITFEELEKKETPFHSFVKPKELDPSFLSFLSNNKKIAASIHYDLDSIQGKFVEFEVPEGVDKDDYLRALANKGLEKRLQKKVPIVYQERLNYELDVIIKTKYSDYFLVVYDYVKYAKTHDILVGPGRGSAAGSLVSYVLGITNVDPIKYNLLFERFLNPERITMPDIDIDFIDSKRDQVIRYIFDKYGHDRSGHVIAFQTFAVRQALRDSAKAWGLTLKEVDVIAKRIPKNTTMNLKELYAQYPEFKKFIDSRQIYRQILQTALKIEGLPRQTTLHAAGIVINNQPLHEVVPIYHVNPELLATQYDMNYLEAAGLLKLDILGLKNLAIIDDCLSNIKLYYKEEVDLQQIDLEDPLIYRLLRSGFTAGIFQVESAGMKRAIQTLRPQQFEDVVALLALFRPGPMEFINTYAKRKEKKEKVDYLHASIQDILEPTYGIIIYQEQIMQILRKMANFTYGNADIVRRAISKKEEAEFKTIEAQFLKGCADNQVPVETAQSIFAMILQFANYGFNRAHSVSYAFITCQMAYLKAKYPLAFFTSLLNSGASSLAGDEKAHEYIDEIKQSSIQLLGPCVNSSFAKFGVEEKALRYSLSHIRGVSNQALALLLQEREQRGLYKDFLDFIVRLVPQGLKKEAIIPLIQAGAFDAFGINRATLLASLDLFVQYASIVATYQNNELHINYTFSEQPKYEEVAEHKEEALNQEYEVLGFFLQTTPIELRRPLLEKAGFPTIKEALQTSDKNQFQIVLRIHSLRTFKTKKHEDMALLKAFDETGSIEVVVFPRAYASARSFLSKNQYVIIRGYIQNNDQVSLIANEINVYKMGDN